MAYTDPGEAPAQIHTRFIDALHGALAHPRFDADHKAEYAGILQTLMRRQARMQQANPSRPAAGPGGPVVEPGAPTSDAQTSALLAALFPPAVPLQAPMPQMGQQSLALPTSILSALRGGL